MTAINRQPRLASEKGYDLIIIGGGIYGVSLAMQASAMGLTNLLVERKDFGWGTTYNHLRTIHGGLRYLQSLDLPRFFESVSERHWFLENFPGLAKPLPCLMPLYGNGPYRPSVFRVALAANDILSFNRNKGVARGQELPAGKVLSLKETCSLFPLVDQQGLLGSALWYDGAMPSPQLLLMAMLTRATAIKTTALNYMNATQVLTKEGQICGLRCTDTESGENYVYRSKKIVNAAGPSCREFAATFSSDDPELFRYSLAWNVLFKQPALSSHSLAIKPKRPGSRMYFVHGFNGLIMGGTVHSAWPANTPPMPEQAAIDAYIDDLNFTVPGLNLTRSDILHIYAGLLPAREQGSAQLAVREIIRDHGASGGPIGVYSVSGVKFTTARLVAEKTLKLIFPEKTGRKMPSQVAVTQIMSQTAEAGFFPANWRPEETSSEAMAALQSIIASQSVLHLDDLLLRRTSLGDDPRQALQLASSLSRLFPWDESRQQEEIQRVRDCFPWLLQADAQSA